MTDEKKIITDEDWKQQAEKEKQRLAEELDGPPEADTPDAPHTLPEPTFPVFLTSLAAEAFMALGEIENPVSKEKKFDPAHATYVIDLLQMIKEKTAGNLAEGPETGGGRLRRADRMR